MTDKQNRRVGNGSVEFWFGRHWLRAQLVRKDRSIAIWDGGIRSHLSLEELFATKDLAYVADVLDPIYAAAQRREEGRRRTLAQAQRKRIRERDRNQCRYCGGIGDNHFGPDRKRWHVDHVQPKSVGGSDDDSNLVLACARCNLRKSDSEGVFVPTPAGEQL